MRSPVCVSKGTPLNKVISAMQDKKRGCAVVMEQEKMAGIFTERDLLTRVLEQGLALSTPIEDVMTKNPDFLKIDASIAETIKLMSEKGHRHLPLVDHQGAIRGFVSARDIVDYLAGHFPYQIYNLPPEPRLISTAPEGA